ncbi:expressed protein [Phakopsora pachyrhizi]|uniref:Expressed protein n=1 Tax=Phakopsora pachyrhizi TaxID=170000 RepID=A0AAV0B031_PHAPC|nr:expressed protein [Phakopsora pachyrhizi]
MGSRFKKMKSPLTMCRLLKKILMNSHYLEMKNNQNQKPKPPTEEAPITSGSQQTFPAGLRFQKKLLKKKHLS